MENLKKCKCGKTPELIKLNVCPPIFRVACPCGGTVGHGDIIPQQAMSNWNHGGFQTQAK